jgi:hypothetical protein
MGEMRNAYKIFIQNFERKEPLGRSMHRWEGNVDMVVMALREVHVGVRVRSVFSWIWVGSKMNMTVTLWIPKKFLIG